MNLELKKEKVRYWSKIGALTLTLTPTVIHLLRGKNPWSDKDWKSLTTDKKAFVIGFWLLFGLMIYLTSYYTLSSLGWPEPLSLFNHLLLIPGLFLTVSEVWEIGKLLLK